MANFVVIDRVKDTASAVNGTTVTLNNSPPSGYQAFSTVGNTNFCFYCIVDTAGNWEATYGAYTASGTTLSRASTPLASSNAGAQVAAFSGTITVFGNDPAAFVAAPWFGINGTRISVNAFSTKYNSATGAIATGNVIYCPIMIQRPFSAATVYFYLSSSFAGTSTVDIGLYSNQNGAPLTRLGQQTGINTGTSSTTGTNATSSLTMPSPQPPGLYWAAYVAHTNAPTVATAFGTVVPGYDIFGKASDLTSAPILAWSQSNATLPTTAGSLTAQAGGNNLDIWMGAAVTF